jgi:hypothetical protein
MAVTPSFFFPPSSHHPSAAFLNISLLGSFLPLFLNPWSTFPLLLHVEDQMTKAAERLDTLMSNDVWLLFILWSSKST